MTDSELFDRLRVARSVSDVGAAVDEFVASRPGECAWIPIGGRENNRGTIEVSSDPGRSAVERLTNGIDAILEAEYDSHNGMPECRSPKEAASAWLNVPQGGLSELTATQRRSLAQRVAVKILAGEGRDSRILEVRDNGIGLSPDLMPGTILSLNESNKMQKHYLAGAYGQGGSSSFAASKWTLIASRHNGLPIIGFTLVRYQDLPPETYKMGRYVYLAVNGQVLEAEASVDVFAPGTVVTHFGYDLSPYPSPVGPNSFYGLLNAVLFDPVLPVWLDDHEVHGYRRVIKGSRNALNGAVDEGDEERRRTNLSHNIPLFFTSLGTDYGRIGVEYWVLERPNRQNKRPSAAFVNPARPIVLTLNGQNHAELPQTLIRRNAELPYLTQRLICHVVCDHLTPVAKRALFASTREDIRRGAVYDLVQRELIRILRSDDELIRLNNEAREQGREEQDESAVQQMRSEVARLLRLQGVDIGSGTGGQVSPEAITVEQPRRPRPPRPPPQPIELHEPPTYIKLVWPEGEDIRFCREQRRYLRVITDAASTYHNAVDPTQSRINFIVVGDGVIARGSTPLEAGRLRLIAEGSASANIGDSGSVRVELSRPGAPTLFDELPFNIVDVPPARPAPQRATLPPFRVRPVRGPTDDHWIDLAWPDDVSEVASSAEIEEGTLVIYYSSAFPKYARHRQTLEQRDLSKANSYTKRYEIWLAVHSLMLQEQQSKSAGETQTSSPDEGDEISETREREERVRVATLSALFAAREVQITEEPAENSD
jgi:hypothetical protein